MNLFLFGSCYVFKSSMQRRIGQPIHNDSWAPTAKGQGNDQNVSRTASLHEPRNIQPCFPLSNFLGSSCEEENHLQVLARWQVLKGSAFMSDGFERAKGPVL